MLYTFIKLGHTFLIGKMYFCFHVERLKWFTGMNYLELQNGDFTADTHSALYKMKLSGYCCENHKKWNEIGNQSKSKTRTSYTISMGKLSFLTPGCSPRIVVFLRCERQQQKHRMNVNQFPNIIGIDCHTTLHNNGSIPIYNYIRYRYSGFMFNMLWAVVLLFLREAWEVRVINDSA